MNDKILETKKEMNRVISDRKRTRLEKDSEIKLIMSSMDERSITILYHELKRDFELDGALHHTETLMVIYFSFLSIVISLCTIEVAENSISIDELISILALVVIITLFFVVGYTIHSIFTLNKKKKIKYAIDNLEEILNTRRFK